MPIREPRIEGGESSAMYCLCKLELYKKKNIAKSLWIFSSTSEVLQNRRARKETNQWNYNSNAFYKISNCSPSFGGLKTSSKANLK